MNPDWLLITSVIVPVASMVVAAGSLLWNIWVTRSAKRSKQAERISAWIHFDDFGEKQDCERVWVYLQNADDQPVYNVIVSTGSLRGAGADYLTGDEAVAVIGTLPAGSYEVWVPYPGEQMHARLEAAIAFQDVFGQSWVRTCAGKLERITCHDTYQEMRVSLPVSRWTKLSERRQ